MCVAEWYVCKGSKLLLIQCVRCCLMWLELQHKWRICKDGCSTPYNQNKHANQEMAKDKIRKWEDYGGF